MTATYDQLPAMKRLTDAGMAQPSAEAVVTEISTATSHLVTREYFKQEMAVQNAVIGKQILLAGIGGGGLLAIGQLLIKAFGLG